MSDIDQQLKSVILGHLIEFQISLAKAKTIPNSDDINLTKFKLLVLLKDCYLIISLYEKEEDIKKTELNRIKEIEEEVIGMRLTWDSLRDMEEIYDEVLKVFKKYLFT